MDVRCDECGTEYELDDALATEQGTVVKCTSCGYEFRVFAPRSLSNGPDEWIVQKASGQKLVFHSLQDLQQAISRDQVLRSDSFSRNRKPFRPLSSVAELDFFFRASSHPSRSGSPPEHGSFPAPAHSTIRKAAPPKPGPEPTQQQPPMKPPGADVTQVSPRADATLPSIVDPAGVHHTGRPPPKPAASAVDILDAAQTLDLSAASAQATRNAAASGSTAERRQRGSDTLLSEDDLHRRSTSLQSPASKGRSVQPRRPTSPEAPEALAHVLAAGVQPGSGAARQTAELGSNAQAAGGDEAPLQRSAGGEPSHEAGALVAERRGSRRPLRPSGPPGQGDSTTTPLEIPASAKTFSVPPELVNLPLEEPGRASYRWILALVLIGGIALFLGTRGRKYLEQFTGGVAEDESAATGALLTAVQPLIDRGELRQAEQQLQGGGGTKTLEHLAALADVQIKQADAHWLGLQVVRQLAALRPAATDTKGAKPAKPDSSVDLEAQNAKQQQELAGILDRLRATVAAGAQRFPDDASVITAKIHFLRLSGGINEARNLVSQLPSANQSSQRDYLLAALDIAENTQSWRGVIDRLKASKVDDRGVGHVRAALVFALMQDQRYADAARELAELERIGSSIQPVGLLRALLNKLDPGAGDRAKEAKEAESSASPVPSSDPVEPPTEPSDDSVSAAGAEPVAAAAGDFRGLMLQAAAAKRSGDYATAEERYLQALEKRSGNVEALSGVAEVYRARGNSAKAAEYYDQAIAVSPGYLPALLGRGDLKWESGDRAGAVRLYEQVLERVDDTHPYGRRARERVDQFRGGGTAKQQPQAAEPRSASGEPDPGLGAHGSGNEDSESTQPQPESKSEPGPQQPEVDTTDLPGLDL